MIRFVLIRPANALNIGAAARAMANFGLSDLVAVDPYARRWRDAHSSRYGSELLSRAKCMTLAEAVADRDLVVGTASAHGRALRRKLIPLPSLGKIRGKKIAVLFGSERDGLSNEDISYCGALLRIPTEAAAPSMNLGQAAALVAYELTRKGMGRAVAAPPAARAGGKQRLALVETALDAMTKVRVNAHLSDKARRMKLREGISRWDLSAADASWLQGLLKKLAARL